jgi:hypothetical protein
MMPSDQIAQRDLLFSKKGSSAKLELHVRIGLPKVIDRTSTGVLLDPGSSVCTITFEGLGINDIEVDGVDTLHALAQAVDIDKYLHGMRKNFDFFWPNGEPYFDDTSP